MMNANGNGNGKGKGKGKFMLFEPEFIKANVGDTVKFVPTNKGHNAEMISNFWPEGATEFVGALNEEVVLTIDKPGVYGIKCKPHYPMGMLAMIVAGDPTNKAQLDSYTPPGTAEKRYNALKEQVGKSSAAVSRKLTRPRNRPSAASENHLLRRNPCAGGSVLKPERLSEGRRLIG